jgi:hypothetical protein
VWGGVVLAGSGPPAPALLLALFLATLTAPAGETARQIPAEPRGPSFSVTPSTSADGPTISITDASAFEGNSGHPGACETPPPLPPTPTACVFFTVSLSAPSSLPVSVQYATEDGTATAPADYDAVAVTTLTFEPGGPTSHTVGVRIAGDPADESNENFNVILANETNATLADGIGVGTILDDDGLPTLFVTGAQVPEGHPGEAIVVVSLAPASGKTVTVRFATANGTAIAGTDFTPIPPAVGPCSPPPDGASCTLMFAPGETSKAITINLLDDTLDEDDESFIVELSDEMNATFPNGNDRHGTVTIINDDPTPSLSVGDTALTEGDVGTVNASFTVSLSAPSGRTVSVSYETASGSATAPLDYTSASGTITFLSGETSKNVDVSVNGDTVFEPDESFFMDLRSPSAAAIADDQGLGTIVNDDGLLPLPPVTDCSDGTDNDADGSIDHPADVGCFASSDETETDLVDFSETESASVPPPVFLPPRRRAICDDGRDNDFDGLIDWPSDPGCSTRLDKSESPNRSPSARTYPRETITPGPRDAGPHRKLPRLAGPRPLGISRVDVRYSRIVTKVAGPKATAKCWRNADWRALSTWAVNRWGPRVAFGVHTWGVVFRLHARRIVNLSPNACRSLDSVVYRKGSVSRYWRAVGVNTLIHEALHIRNHDWSESLVQCTAMQLIETYAPLFRIKRATGRAYARLVWNKLYHKLPAEYRSSLCRNGGLLDLHPASSVWP